MSRSMRQGPSQMPAQAKCAYATRRRPGAPQSGKSATLINIPGKRSPISVGRWALASWGSFHTE
jgi:hypothetical protein